MIDRKTRQMLSVLYALQDGYESGDFTAFFRYLKEDSIFESQWVLEPHVGYDDIVTYLTNKGNAIKKAQAFPKGIIVQLIGNMNSAQQASIHVNGEASQQGMLMLWYEDGKQCLLLTQKLEGKKSQALVEAKLDDDGMVNRIDMCIPELFRFDISLYDREARQKIKEGLRKPLTPEKNIEECLAFEEDNR